MVLYFISFYTSYAINVTWPLDGKLRSFVNIFPFYRRNFTPLLSYIISLFHFSKCFVTHHFDSIYSCFNMLYPGSILAQPVLVHIICFKLPFGKLKGHETGRSCKIMGPGNELEKCVLRDWPVRPHLKFCLSHR